MEEEETRESLRENRLVQPSPNITLALNVVVNIVNLATIKQRQYTLGKSTKWSKIPEVL